MVVKLNSITSVLHSVDIMYHHNILLTFLTIVFSTAESGPCATNEGIREVRKTNCTNSSCNITKLTTI